MGKVEMDCAKVSPIKHFRSADLSEHRWAAPRAMLMKQFAWRGGGSRRPSPCQGSRR